MPAKVIRKLKYVSPDGKEFDTPEEEKRHEIEALLPAQDNPTGWSVDHLAAWMVENASKLIPILRQGTRKNASPKVRKPRTVKAAPATT